MGDQSLVDIYIKGKIDVKKIKIPHMDFLGHPYRTNKGMAVIKYVLKRTEQHCLTLKKEFIEAKNLMGKGGMVVISYIF